MSDGVMIDILPRLSMATVDRVLADVKRTFKAGGAEAGKDMSAGFTAGFAEISRTSEASFREMQRGMFDLQLAEARVNSERLASYEKMTDGMIAAQKRLNDVIAQGQKLMADSREADAAVVAGSRTSAYKRTPIIPRTANIVGGGAAAIAGGIAIGGLDIAARTSQPLNDILVRHQDSADNVQRLTQASYRIAGQTGISPQDLGRGAEAVEQAGYRGQNAVSVLETAAKVAQMAHTDIDTAVAGITTTMNDFKVNGEQNNPAKFLDDMNNIAGKLVVTLGNLKDVNPAEYFKSLANIEPIAGQYMPNVNPNQASAQVDAIASIASQAGMPPERAMLNAAQVISQMGNPKGPKAKALEQLGLRPEDLATTMRDQGVIPVLDKINNAIQSKFDPNTGLYNMGWKFNDAGQLKALQQIDIDQLGGMGDQGAAALQLLQTTPFQNATATNKSIQKAFDDAGITDPTITGTVKNWLQFQKTANGPSAGVQGGQMPQLTQAQVVSSIAGTGDVQRSMLPLLQNMPQLKNMLDQYSSEGNAQGFKQAFDQWQQTLPAKMKILEGNLEDFAGTLGQTILPAATRLAGDLNSAADWLDKHKAAEEALVAAMVALAGAWSAAKLINLGADLLPALSFAADKAKALGTILSERLPTQIEAGASTFATEMQTAGATSATTLEGGATTAAGEIAAGGSAFKAGLLAAIPDLLAMVAPVLAAAAGGIALGQYTNPSLPASSGHHADVAVAQARAGMANPSAISKALHGHAYGGVVGQPLMGVPDTGGDSVLGMLPNGQPVGLRGGEGILTPETVQALGGEDGVNALNANPWSNPGKVASTFYGSFAKGVAQYSPWGKYLTATSQTLDSLTQASQDAQAAQGGPTQAMTPGLSSSPAYGASRASYPHGASGTQGAIQDAYAQSGFPPGQFADLQWIIAHESGGNPNARNPSSGAYGIGQFLGHEHDKYGAMGAYSGDAGAETRAMLQYISDRYGSPAAAKSFWQSHGWYSQGGVIPQSPSQHSTTPSPSHRAEAPQKAPQKGNQAPMGPTGKRESADVLAQVFGTGNNGMPNGPSGDRNIMANPSQQLTAEGKGFSISGGIIGAAESAAMSAANVSAFGAPAGSLAQPLFDLANRAMGYGGQLVGIGLEGLMETLLPNDSPGADPSKNIFGKMALGIAGAHPSGSNMAGSHAKQLDPKKDLDAGAAQAKQQPASHTFNFGDIHGNGTDQASLQKAVNHAVNIGSFAGT